MPGKGKCKSQESLEMLCRVESGNLTLDQSLDYGIVPPIFDKRFSYSCS